MAGVDMSAFTGPRSFDDCAELVDPKFLSGYMTEWHRQNPDGTFVVVESVWGTRCSSWDGSEPVPPLTCSQTLTVTSCTDIEDIDGSETGSDRFFFDGDPADFDSCERAARGRAETEATGKTVHVPERYTRLFLEAAGITG